jgi:transcriptional regulator with XRE-family HTH domain
LYLVVDLSTIVDVTRQPTAQLGDAIRAARDGAGLSTQAAAERARISPAYLNKLESGRVGTPSPRVLHRLAGVIDVPYWRLMHLADYVPADDPDPGSEPAPRAQQASGHQARAAATNDRLLEVLRGIEARLDALADGQQRLLRALPGD